MTSIPSIKGRKRSKPGKYQKALSKDGLIIYDRETPSTIRFDHQETEQFLEKKIDFTKIDHHCEVAHLEISNNCNMSCSYCYVPHKNGRELPTREWKKIIYNLADAGVFQVSFGGGEPTLRKDLFDLAKIVADTGMNLGMTTNGTKLHNLSCKKLRTYFKQINVSWHGNPEIFEEALELLHAYDIPRGINYNYTKEYSRDNDMVKFLAQEFEAEILYLVYKPVIKDLRNQIPANEVYKVAKVAANEGLCVAVDGPCINQCLMKKKFVDVGCMGDVFPCSFVRNSLGNLLYTDFKRIWKNRGSQQECPFVTFRKES